MIVLLAPKSEKTSVPTRKPVLQSQKENFLFYLKRHFLAHFYLDWASEFNKSAKFRITILYIEFISFIVQSDNGLSSRN